MEKGISEKILSPGGIISAKHPNYEFRPQQVEMAKAVEEAILSQHHLIIEAGTGIGKSLAYLIPFIIWAKDENKKIIISTNTKTLQEQLVKKDLPFLRQSLDIDFEFALCVGAENYLCLRRLNHVFEYGLLDLPEEYEQVKKIDDWQSKTKAGLKLDMDFQVLDKIWNYVCRESDLCPGKRCLWRKDCYYAKARRFQAKANILVLNHHLFFANIVSAGRVVSHYDAVVFDEAHTLEDVATNYLGIQIANTQIDFLLNSIYNPRNEKGLITRIPELTRNTEVFAKLIKNAKTASDLFFGSILDSFGSEEGKMRTRSPLLFENHLSPNLAKLSSELKNSADEIKTEEYASEVKAYSARCNVLAQDLSVIMSQLLKDNVYWVESVIRPNFIRCSLHACPIDVSRDLKKYVFDATKPVILTSATLTTNKSFWFIRKRLGLYETDESLLDSPFDYQKQALLYIAEDLADPSDKLKEYQEQLNKRVEEILKITGGRTFVLFTSYEMLGKVRDSLSNLKEVKILCQGELPRWKLVEKFKQSKNTALLATYSFWQGIDIPGKALECVVIAKLPFAVPDEPVVEAKIEYLAKKGIEPFINYQLPQAIIMLRQGFGRLIRTKDDRGVVAILDPRIRLRAYGSKFLDSLPKCTVTTEVSDIGNFITGQTISD